MNYLLKLYLSQQNWINLAKDAVFFFGAYKIIAYIWNLNFLAKTGKIEKDLKVRESLEEKLNCYVLEQHKNGIKDIALRFIYWKNYPWKLHDDGYKHCLAINYNGDHVLPSGWIDKTGINFQEHLWFFCQSIYVDKSGIFFFAPKDGSYKGFEELKEKRLFMHLPFSNIVNFDFKEFIEYEPVLYVKHVYHNHRKLYDRTYVCREKLGEGYFRLQLDRRYQICKYSFLRYQLSRAGYAVDAFINGLMTKQS